jgi:hypothetical protein
VQEKFTSKTPYFLLCERLNKLTKLNKEYLSVITMIKMLKESGAEDSIPDYKGNNPIFNDKLEILEMLKIFNEFYNNKN